MVTDWCREWRVAKTAPITLALRLSFRRNSSIYCSNLNIIFELILVRDSVYSLPHDYLDKSDNLLRTYTICLLTWSFVYCHYVAKRWIIIIIILESASTWIDWELEQRRKTSLQPSQWCGTSSDDHRNIRMTLNMRDGKRQWVTNVIPWSVYSTNKSDQKENKTYV